MDAIKILYIVILIIIFLVVFLVPGSPIYTSGRRLDDDRYKWRLFIAGYGTGLISVAFIAIILAFWYRKKGKIVSSKCGYTMAGPGRSNSTPEGTVTNSNFYVVNNGKIVAPYAVVPCHPAPNPALQGRVSACSEYTESHYYSEIDEYYINKRNEKLAAKFQKSKVGHPAVYTGTPAPATSSSNHSDNTAFMYDYAYGQMPLK